MSMAEGSGLCVPAPVAVRLSSADRQYARYHAERQTKDRRYAASSDEWKRGLRADAIEVGTLGEIAVGRYLGLAPDISRKPNGGGDFILSTGEGVEVKTGRLLVKLGASLSSFYVFCRIAEPDVAELVGFLSCDDLRKQRVCKGKGDWLNYEVDQRWLSHVSNLRMYVRSLGGSE